MTILEITDNDFLALLRGQLSVRPGLTQPPGGVDTPDVIAQIRELTANLSRHGYIGGHWMMVAGGEVVGLCGFKAPLRATARSNLALGSREVAVVGVMQPPLSERSSRQPVTLGQYIRSLRSQLSIMLCAPVLSLFCAGAGYDLHVLRLPRIGALSSKT